MLRFSTSLTTVIILSASNAFAHPGHETTPDVGHLLSSSDHLSSLSANGFGTIITIAALSIIASIAAYQITRSRNKRHAA